MKPANQLFFSLAMTLSIAVFASCSKSDDEKVSAPTGKNEAPDKSGVTIDTATQERIGLKIEPPTVLAWQPEIKCFGRVLVPATLVAAVAELESARSTAEVSRNEYTRQKTLAAQNNASVRVLETAKADATRDELAFQTARAKFKQDWGVTLLENNNREQTISNIVSGNESLVRIDLPVGETLPSPSATARIVVLGDETNFVDGEFFGALDGVDPQTQGRSFLLLTPRQSLASGAAATALLKTAGQPVSGVVVPAGAVLRHAGANWVYVETETNQFVRTKIPLDRPTDNGWFVSENLSATDRIVVVGAQTVLSAELSGGGFNTGERD